MFLYFYIFIFLYAKMHRRERLLAQKATNEAEQWEKMKNVA
jgi:hypothetical protein